MDKDSTAFIDEWPKVSFDEIEGLEIEGDNLRIFYQSFFHLLHVPERIFLSFKTLFAEELG